MPGMGRASGVYVLRIPCRLAWRAPRWSRTGKSRLDRAQSVEKRTPRIERSDRCQTPRKRGNVTEPATLFSESGFHGFLHDPPWPQTARYRPQPWWGPDDFDLRRAMEIPKVCAAPDTSRSTPPGRYASGPPVVLADRRCNLAGKRHSPSGPGTGGVRASATERSALSGATSRQRGSLGCGGSRRCCPAPAAVRAPANRSFTSGNAASVRRASTDAEELTRGRARLAVHVPPPTGHGAV